MKTALFIRCGGRRDQESGRSNAGLPLPFRSPAASWLRTRSRISSGSARLMHHLTLLAVGLGLVTGSARITAQIQWVERPIPSGILYHPQFGVTVHHDQVGFFPPSETEGLSSYAPVIPAKQLGHITLTGRVSSGTRMALEPVSGLVFELVGNGALNVFDQATGVLVGLGNVRLARWDVSEVYDTGALEVRPGFGGHLVPGLSHFGDIAVQQADDTYQVYVTGVSVAFPFVLRLRFERRDFNFRSAKVLVASSASTAPEFNHPRGIAIRSDGWLVTTLPMNFGLINRDVVFTLPGGFDPDVDLAPISRLGNFHVLSKGMTVDEHDQVYVATGSVGDPAASGTVIILNPSLDDFFRLEIGNAIIQNSVDLAVHPNGSQLFVSMANNPVLNHWSGIVLLHAADPVEPTITATSASPRSHPAGGGQTTVELAGGDLRGIVRATAAMRRPDGTVHNQQLELRFGRSTRGVWGATLAVPPNIEESDREYVIVLALEDAVGNTTISPPLSITVAGSPNHAALEIASWDAVGDRLQISWTGGVGPFEVQQRSRLKSGTWATLVVGLEARSFSTSIPGGRSGFFRVLDQGR